MRRWFSRGALAALAGLSLTAAPALGAEDRELPEPPPDMPPEYEQLLARGEIPAVVDPQFVSADEAEIADEAWVLGVVVDGRPKAYSLNLLNHHEVVNDRSGERAFAAVW